MSSDGYVSDDLSRLEKIKVYSDAQSKLNNRLKEIAKEISILPKIPRSMDEWIGSWSEPGVKGFGIDTFNKHVKIKKEYSKIIENADSNLREMKILAIEDLLDKINNTLNKSD